MSEQKFYITSEQKEYKEALDAIESQFLGGVIPGELFPEMLRNGGLYDDGDSCWEKSVNQVEEFIQKQRDYIEFLENKVTDLTKKFC